MRPCRVTFGISTPLVGGRQDISGPHGETKRSLGNRTPRLVRRDAGVLFGQYKIDKPSAKTLRTVHGAQKSKTLLTWVRQEVR